jgi:ABC-type proline/glycine betaine transport system permease subunit
LHASFWPARRRRKARPQPRAAQKRPQSAGKRGKGGCQRRRGVCSARRSIPGLLQRFWQRLWADDLRTLTGQHLLLVLLSVGAAALIAVPAGVLLFPHARLRALALGLSGVVQTIPSLALLAVLIALLG